MLIHTSELRDHPPERSFGAAAAAAVCRAGHAVADMAYLSASELCPADICRAMVAGADIYVAIVGLRYGSVVDARPHQSYTELEFETATSLGLPRLIFVVRADGQLPPDD